MEDLLLFTDSPFDQTKCQQALQTVFKGIDVGKDYIHYGKPPKSFAIEAELQRENETTDPLDKDIAKRVPILHPYCTILSYHYESISMAQKVIAALKTVYPELYIYDDYEWVGAADDFLKLNYQEIYLNRLNK